MGEPSGTGGRQPPVGVLLPTPAPEVLETVLSQRYGPLPRVAAIARLRKQPAGGYQPAGDLADMLERRQAANAKERERVRGPPPPPKTPNPLHTPPPPQKQILGAASDGGWGWWHTGTSQVWGGHPMAPAWGRVGLILGGVPEVPSLILGGGWLDSGVPGLILVSPVQSWQAQLNNGGGGGGVPGLILGGP